MQKTVYESCIGIMPYSDSFLRKAVLEYQLYLIAKEGLTDNISCAYVIVGIPMGESINRKIVRTISEWFEKELNMFCNIKVKQGKDDCYNFRFLFVRKTESFD